MVYGVVYHGTGKPSEATMMVQQFSQKDKQSSTQKREANLGQKEAGQEKEKKSELSSMGERSSKFSGERNAKRQSE
jgi:hypothetical protein